MARGDFGTMRIGYARVSTTDQKPELQINALLSAGIDHQHLYEGRMSGLRADRPKLTEALAYKGEDTSLGTRSGLEIPPGRW
jgi:DNA invertase Pin-like site-specific DNA recombinase